jgi:hypothetical protein
MSTRRIKISMGQVSVIVQTYDSDRGLMTVAAISADQARQAALELSAYAEQIEKRSLTIHAG